MKKETLATLWQFIKFNIVGLTNTAVDFAVYFLLTDLAGLDYVLAQTISYAAGIANSYLWNTLWTFKKEKRRTAREALLFILVNLASYGVSVGVLALFKDVWGVPNELINKAAASLCSALVNFAGNKLFVFNKPALAEEEQEEEQEAQEKTEKE